MDKVYRLLHWLDMAQAVDWLQDLTATRVTTPDLLQLCEFGKCAAYILPDIGAISPLKGLPSGTDKYLVQTWNQRNVSSYVSIVTPNGCQQVSNAAEFLKSGTNVISELKMIGDVTTGSYSDGKRFEIDGTVLTFDEGHAHWSALVEMRNCFPLFKPKDIQALAAKLNGVEENRDADDAELDELRQQLEMERSKREDAEARVAELIQQIGNTQQDNPHESATIGLSFPYATKELEVMRRVALEHWSGHTPDKRQPKQDTIQRAICNELGMDVPTNKTPPNKAIYLAMAIKPDGLPKA